VDEEEVHRRHSGAPPRDSARDLREPAECTRRAEAVSTRTDVDAVSRRMS
jgi:hypothetical protein